MSSWGDDFARRVVDEQRAARHARSWSTDAIALCRELEIAQTARRCQARQKIRVGDTWTWD